MLAEVTTDWYVGWGTLALINAVLGQLKNKASGGNGFGGFAWFIISLFIGPLATLAIALKD